MLELLKLIVDALVLRDASRKGMLSWRVVLFGFAFAIFLYATGLSAGLLYIKHPQYKWLFILAIVIDAIALILYFIYGTRWYLRAKARADAKAAAQPLAGTNP